MAIEAEALLARLEAAVSEIHDHITTPEGMAAWNRLNDADFALRSALAEDTARAVEGWVTVPRKPTPDMLTAGIEGNPTVWTEGTDQGFAQDVANDVYVSMLAAAPALPLTKEAADANR